ncbi:FHA domain-containing protein [Streptomyces sp. JB150]|uniref:FHA domain-containing protein n=1 Tax=Streptomyces sp. JB150 TaxID=2714844 RepID=UPI00140C0B06|nr:FHA domain-containing protein [Streptomyces sp. JB150]QIJ63034.1 FHA domain-containing protein [Streptomyces sp. JB150]
MQIRLTVVDPLGPPSAEARGRAASRDVLVTAPAGTALSAVASALASAVTGDAAQPGPVVLYAGAERLDDRRCTLGEPPLLDGAVLSLGAPADPEPHPEVEDAPARLDVVAGPDAGGVHLLHGGRIEIGRSAAADVPLDDPDVSRLHCAVTLSPDGRVTVADLGSTNGTTLDGTRVGARPVRFTPGALLRLGESALRLAPAGGPGGRLATAPDGEGHVRVAPVSVPMPASVAPSAGLPQAPESHTRADAPAPVAGQRPGPGPAAAQDHAPAGPPVRPPVVPGQGAAPREERGEGTAQGGPAPDRAGTAGNARTPQSVRTDQEDGGRAPRAAEAVPGGRPGRAPGSPAAPLVPPATAQPPLGDGTTHGGRQGVPGLAGAPAAHSDGQPHDADAQRSPQAGRRRGGIGAWARRLTGGRGEPAATDGPTAYDDAGGAPLPAPAAGPRLPETWPDPAALLLTALGPGPRLWERGPGHPEALTVRLGTADRAAPDGSELLPAVPVTADLREAGALGLAGPRPRLAGVARAVLAQLAALHSPTTLEIVLISTDHSRSVADRTAEWSWLGWLPHVRPGHGQDCRLLLAYDREQAATRTDELLRRLDDHLTSVLPAPAADATPARTPADTGQGTAAREPGTAAGHADSGLLPAETDTEAQSALPSGPTGATRAGTGQAYPAPAGAAPADGPQALPGHHLTGGGRTPYPAAGKPGPADRPRAEAPADTDGAAAAPGRPGAAGAAPAGHGPRGGGHGTTHGSTGTHAAVPAPAGDPRAAAQGVPGSPRAGAQGLPGGTPRPGSGSPYASPGGAAPAAGPRHPAVPAGAEPAAAARGCLPAGALPAQAAAPAAPAVQGPADQGPAAAHPAPTAPRTVPDPQRRPSWARHGGSEAGSPGSYTVVVVDGDPGSAGLRDALARLAAEGPRAGIHVVCLAETAPASPASPVTETYEAACAAVPVFRRCGAVALLSGDVATALRLLRVAPAGPVGHGTVATVDAVSPAWAERFARALAPLRPDGTGGERQARVSAPLPQSARLLDELGLARATPASLMARWADAADDTRALGGRAWAVLGAGPRGPACADLAADGPHLLIEGPAGSGRTELLRAIVASLAAAERPDRLGIVLMDGRDTVGTGTAHGDGLRVCTDVPHVTTHLTANDPVRMREFAQSLSAELKRRAELLGRSDFTEWHTGRELAGRMVAQRAGRPAGQAPGRQPGPKPGLGTAHGTGPAAEHSSGQSAARIPAQTPPQAPGHGTAPGTTGAADLDTPPSSTLRLRPSAARRTADVAPPLPRLVVVVDDLDALVAPPLGSPGRPAAGSVVRALEAVAREGERLGVHLVAAAGPGDRTAESEASRRARLRIVLDAPAAGPDEPAPGRGRLTGADGKVTPFQGGRVTGRIPRTATLRPTVVPLDWHRMGDPPARRPVRELGNGPTDLALLASALERAAREVSASEVPSLL